MEKEIETQTPTSAQQEINPPQVTTQETLPQQHSAGLRGPLKTYWIVDLIAVFSLIAVFALQGIALEYFRNSVGLLLTLWLPGYSLVKALFVSEASPFSQRGGSGLVLTAAFSVVFSIIVVSLVGFVLNYTSWGINLQSLTVSVSLSTILFASVAMYRRYRVKKTVT